MPHQMGSGMRSVEGDVVTLRCEQCGTTFHHFVFSGDTDMATAGLGSLSSCLGNDVVISEMTATEWNAAESGQKAFSTRVSEALGRDLATVSLSAEETRKPFLSRLFARRSPDVAGYACACCSGGRAREVRRAAVDQFQAEGGRVTIFGDLVLAPVSASRSTAERRQQDNFASLEAVLLDARALLQRPGNDFSWSSWGDAKEALAEIDQIIAEIRPGHIPRSRLSISVLFAPTGPIQEVSVSSGWGDEFLALASRFDAALARV